MKKKINIVLILAVLGLWGTVVYKAVSQYLFPKEFVENATASTKSHFNSNLINKDTFHLEAIPRDPFLNKQYQNPIVPKVFHPKSINKTVAQVIIPIVNKNWPTITYYGYIKSKEKNEELILVKINQKLHKLRKTDQVEGVTINKVYNDSIALYFNKEKRIIRLNK